MCLSVKRCSSEDLAGMNSQRPMHWSIDPNPTVGEAKAINSSFGPWASQKPPPLGFEYILFQPDSHNKIYHGEAN
jgi:hypothetical protein